MIIINVTGFLTDFTGGRSELRIDAAPSTVREALEQLWGLHVGLRDRVVNEQGELRPHVNIFVNNENIRRKQLLDTELSNASEITILPSVSGGTIHDYTKIRPTTLGVGSCGLVDRLFGEED
jgi:MoaD family protein